MAWKYITVLKEKFGGCKFPIIKFLHQRHISFCNVCIMHMHCVSTEPLFNLLNVYCELHILMATGSGNYTHSELPTGKLLTKHLEKPIKNEPL